jgi:microsomal dipeptidase-like Zn-dependent dipeptidase
LERQVAETPDIDVAQSNADLNQIIDRKNIALIHTVEGGHVLGDGLDANDLDGHIERLQTLADRGVASLTLAHLFPNDLAGHTNAIPQKLLKLTKLNPQADPKKGLTELGRGVLEEMIRLRMIPDIMHCNPKSRHEIYERVNNRIPIIASHAGVQSMNGAEYNLDRTDVKAITRSKGLIGVIFMPEWLKDPDPKDGLDAIWETMATIREWSGSWNAVAIGTDFDGFTDPANDCKSEGELGRVGEILKDRGLTQVEIDAVLGANAREVLARGWGRDTDG